MKTHPWLEKYPINKFSKYLIIGTHPPMPYTGTLEYYYGNMNEFWRFLDAVYPGNNLYKNECPKLDDIQLFLDRIKMSITDIVYKTHVDRFSTDNDMGTIMPDELNPFLTEWLKDSSIEKIYFTSFGGKNSAKQLFKKWYKKEFNRVCKISKNHINSIEIHGRSIQCIDLFSPSPTANRSSNRVKEFQDYKKDHPNNTYDDFRIEWYRTHLPQI
jgi:G:T/U-mismatch repair DNA glycosylase